MFKVFASYTIFCKPMPDKRSVIGYRRIASRPTIQKIGFGNSFSTFNPVEKLPFNLFKR